jgi:2-polyprenyl-3-methyl-5-hydroxy-6-metoxy-1,4-benzoquinol methylase
MDDKKRLKAKNSFDGSIVFQKRDFEKITGRNVHRKNLIKTDLYFNKFINPRNQEFYKKYVNKRACPVCDSEDHNAKLFNKNGASHVKCQACGMVFVTPVLKESFLIEFYQNNNSWLNVLGNQYQRELDKKKYKYVLNLIKGHVKSSKINILDVGCAYGLFLDVAMQNGWNVFGVEINKDAIRELAKNNICYWDSIEGVISSQKKFEAVTMWDIFEHLYHPGKILELLAKVLRKGGLLFMNLPNILSLSSRILQEKSSTFDGRCHINFFSDKTITMLLKKHKFRVVETETIVTELKTVSNYLNFDDPYSPVKKHPYFHLFTPEIIHQNRWGSRLLVYAEKI